MEARLPARRGVAGQCQPQLVGGGGRGLREGHGLPGRGRAPRR